MGVFLPPLSAAAVGSDVVEDDLAYADVFTLQRERVPAGMLVELLLERIAVLDAPAPGSHKSLRSVLAISETARAEARAQDELRAQDEPPAQDEPRAQDGPGPPMTTGRTGRCTAYRCW